jgi:glycosyltransferase involved in cell wall biosynthesis
VLARQGRVTVGTPNDSDLHSPAVDVRSYAGDRMAALVSDHDVVVAFGYLLRQHPVIARQARFLVMDLYDPFLLENLTMHDDLPMARRMGVHEHDLGVVRDQLFQADFFICASERQRDYWLGALSMVNRVNPQSYAQDATLRRLIDVVAFGLPAEPPASARPAIREEVAAIAADDVVVLWGGGIWNWFDPLTAIRAVASLRAELPGLKLFFMGLRHPNPELPQMAMARRAVELAAELGVLDRQVFFRDGWVPYEDRVNYLMSADIGISLHFDHVETRFSYRTRLLDYLWAGLPVVATAGDVLSNELAAGGAGVAVPEADVEAVAGALRRLATDPAARSSMRERARRLAADHTWERVAAPLLDYCRSPYASRPAGALDPDALRLSHRLRAAWWRSPLRRAAGKIRRRLRGRRR